MRQPVLQAECNGGICHAGQEQPATKWLDEHNSGRVSYFEPTIFTLRQAGIPVEPHWFGPIKCVALCAHRSCIQTRHPFVLLKEVHCPVS
jgi:hypothetical protein